MIQRRVQAMAVEIASCLLIPRQARGVHVEITAGRGPSVPLDCNGSWPWNDGGRAVDELKVR